MRHPTLQQIHDKVPECAVPTDGLAMEICRNDQHWTPDLILLDFHVWGYIKNMVYECKVNASKKLPHCIFNAEKHMNDTDVTLNQPNFQISVAP
jgi:hypothetical protein